MAAQENIVVLDLAEMSLRQSNEILHGAPEQGDDGGHYRIINPQGRHALACGLKEVVSVEIAGHAGYYCAGMNKHAEVTIDGNAGQGVAENMISGVVHVKGDCSQAAGATAHGGLLIVEGNAAARCGISLKGADIVVKGNVGHMSCFMAQAGRFVVLGDAGAALGDSLYEARLYIRGDVESLGADCVEKDMTDEHRSELNDLLARANCTGVSADEFRRYGSARNLYNFKPDNLDAY